MFTGSGNSSGPQGSKNPYASSQASKSLSATFSSQGTAQGTHWQNRSNTAFGTPNAIFSGGFGGGSGSTGSGFGTLAASQPSTGFGSTSTPAVDSSSSTGWNSRPPGGFSLSTKPPSTTPVSFKCRMCQTVFTTSEDLKKHIKAEGHFDTSRATGSTFGSTSFGSGPQPPRSFNSQPIAQGDSSAGGLFGLSGSAKNAVANDGSGNNLNATAAPFTPQPRATTLGQSFGGQPRAPRGAPLGAGGPPPPSTAPPPQQQQQQSKPWEKKPLASQDARQSQPHAPRSFVPNQPPHPSTPFGQGSAADASSLSTSTQGKPGPAVSANPYARPSATTFSNVPGNASGLAVGKTHPFVPHSAAPRPFTSNKVPSTGFGGLQSIQEKSVLGTAKLSSPRTSGGINSASNATYNSQSSADEGNDDGEDDDEGEEEDDLNFSFSSQESATGDIPSTHSSPMKGPGLGSPAAAARARAEEVPQRALFTQSAGADKGALSSHHSAPSFGVTSHVSGGASVGQSGAVAGAQSGATSSLMGFMKASSKFPAASAQSNGPSNTHQNVLSSQYTRASEDSNQGSDTESSNADGTDAMGTCEDMCPAEERTKRLNESDIHKLEIPHPEMTPGRNDYAFTMVKKFQRSSADHALQIPHLLRTPEALLRSIEYIENELMDRASKAVFDPRIGEAPSTLFIYLFVWDRYRMVAKDFTLQQSMLPLSRIWVECHERMARWFILMDHKMQAADDFLSAGHGQQNGESLNNLLKTLHGYYFRSRVGADTTTTATTNASVPIDMPNKAEFVCYFVLFQLGNGGEVSKYLQQLPDEVLNSTQVRFAIEVWGALKTQNYAKYFRLLRTCASLLQACLMHRYLGEVRLTALKKLTRSLNPPGNKPQEYVLRDLMSLFMFESVGECVEFVEHCGLTCCPSTAADLDPAKAGTPTEDFVVLLSGQNIDHLLPRDKNDRPIPPVTHYMEYAIDTLKCLRNNNNSSNSGGNTSSECYCIAEVCRGFATGGSAPVFAPPAPASYIRPTSVPIQYPTQSKKTGEIGVRTPTAMSNTPLPNNNNTNNTTNTSVATPVVPVLTETERSAAKARFLAGMGSGRGVKKAASPIAPVTDADVWGPPDVVMDKKSDKEDKKGNKRITPTFGASAASVNNNSGSGGFGGGSWNKPTTTATSTAGMFGQPSSDGTKPASFPFGGNNAATPASTGSSGGVTSGAGASQDSWRRAAPAGSKDTQQDSNNNAASGAGNGSGGSTSTEGQQKVSAFGALPSAVPSAVPATAVAFGTLGASTVATNNVSNAAIGAMTKPVLSTLPAFPSFPAPTTTTAPPAENDAPAAAFKTAAPTTGSAFSTTTEAGQAGTSVVPAPSSSFSTGTAAATAGVTPQEVTAPTPPSTFASTNTGGTGSTLNPASAVFVPAAAKVDQTGSFAAITTNINTNTTSNDAGSFNKTSTGSATIATPTAVPAVVPARPPVDQTKLDAFQRRIAHKQQLLTQKGVLLIWRTTAHHAAAQRQARVTALYFLLWRQGCKRSKRERDGFLSDITSIQMVDPLTQELGGMSIFGSSVSSTVPREGNVLKRKQAQQLENQQRLMSMVERETLARFILLCDAETTDTTSSSVDNALSCAYSTVKVRQQRHTKSLLDTVGRTLRAVKTLQLHSLLGLPVAPSALHTLRTATDSTSTIQDGPQYTGALCFKLAVISECTVAGVACKHGQAGEQCFCYGFSNAFRSQLANERGYGYTTATINAINSTEMSKAQLGKMKKRRGQLARALATRQTALTAVRVGLHTHALDAHTTLQLSIVDVCGDGTSKLSANTTTTTGATACSVDPTAQVEAVTDLSGTQGAVIVVNTTHVGYVTSALQRVRQCAGQDVPVVLVLFHTIATATTSAVHEVSREDLLYATSPTSPCSVVRQVLSKMCAALPTDQRDAFLNVVQGSIVVDVPVSRLDEEGAASVASGEVVRWSMQRALQLLAVAASPTPVVLRLQPEELLLHHLHSVRDASDVTDLTPLDTINQGEVSEENVRAIGHAALERAINKANDNLNTIAELLKAQEDTNKSYAYYPASDFVTLGKSSTESVSSVAYLSNGVLDLSNLIDTTSTTTHTAASDLLLPRDWVESSQLTYIAEKMTSLRYFGYSPDMSIAAYQKLLAFEGRTGVCASSFASSLEAVLNRAYATRQVSHLPGDIDNIVLAVTIEAVRNLCDSMPHQSQSVYIALDQPASLVAWLKPVTTESLLCSEDHATTDNMDGQDCKGGSYEVYTTQEAVLMSPTGNVYMEQSQYAQAFPTGFGRSLFAQFSRDSILTLDTPKVKRSFDAEGIESGDKRVKYNIADLHTTTPQRNNYNNRDGNNVATPQSAGYGVAYDKLFGSAAKNNSNNSISSAPSTPHTTTLSSDPGTRALQGQMRSEQAATDRLNNLLEAALSPLRSPVGARISTAFTPTNAHSNAHSGVSSGNGNQQAQQDPMQFIAECRRERERFEAVVIL